MRKTVNVRGVEIGAGLPKICVPICGADASAIICGAKAARASGADLVEWRADFFEGRGDEKASTEMLKAVRGEIGDMPLIYTLRTKSEGGLADMEFDEYAELCAEAAATGLADIIDVEALREGCPADGLVEELYLLRVKTLLSHHEFSCTPPEEKMLSLFRAMRDMHGDVVKLAVMPQSPADVLALLSACACASSEEDMPPVVAMSMGKLGAVSRVCGETFGSAITFASLGGAASAPGQMDISDVKRAIDALRGE